MYLCYVLYAVSPIACTGCRPVCAWFLEIDFVHDVCMCVSVYLPRGYNTSGMIWTPYDWLNKLYSFYMAAVVIIGSRHGLTISLCYR